MSGHTPTPWSYDGNCTGHISQGGAAIAKAYCEADVRFIVRAVNAHEAMVEAMEALLPSVGWSNYDDDELRREHELGNGKAKKILAARAALKLARGDQ